jgi:Fe-S cluster biogenesis protein NfuA
MEKVIPHTVYAESTPNPATMKFVANRVLLEEGLAEYTDMDEAKGSPVAMKLFGFPFVTVMKSDMVSWEDVLMELREFIRDYLNSGGAVVTDLVDGAIQTEEQLATTAVHSTPTSDLEEQIIAILDAEIAPAVAQDGGNITFKGYDKGVVNVVLRGSCSGCPSSTVTLKNGIETLLQSRFPGEISEVVAVNG